MFKAASLAAVVLVGGILTPCLAQPRNQVPSDQAGRRIGLPAEYAGKWICQSSVPGYNLPLPVTPGHAPSTQRMTTQPSTVLIKFTLNSDGSYEEANTKCHYSFNAASKTIDWLDGPYQKQLLKTQIARRANGAPSLSLHANQRYYGCFLATESGTGKSSK